MSVVVDLTGQKFFRLTVIEHAGRNKHKRSLWNCLCYCGATKVIDGTKLKSGNTRSCGCLNMETRVLSGRKNAGKKNALKHGHSKSGKGHGSPSYSSWQAMKLRCLNPNAKSYLKYGGANPPVTICGRWKDSFENFLADVGERLPGTTLGRFKDVGNYEVGNVSWMTPAQQRANWKSDRNMGICTKTKEQIAA
jgi:hypothetical protein